MQYQYWLTKKTVSRKLGGKEDECVIASDNELDTKLELFKSISDNSIRLQRIIDMYQDRLSALADVEVSLGHYLKECAKNEKNSNASQILALTGRVLSANGHQRAVLHPILLRFHNELVTFIDQAVTDTRITVNQMEEKRTEYRATLSWMKAKSNELDPDSNVGVRQFRKIQAHVKDRKSKFDQYTLASLQKIDLLAAARCNMFSHSLASHQQAVFGLYSKLAENLNQTAEKIEEIHKNITTDLSSVVNQELRDVYTANKLNNDNNDNNCDSRFLDVDDEKLLPETFEPYSNENGHTDPISSLELLQEMSWPSDTFMPSNLLQDALDTMSKSAITDTNNTLRDHPVHEIGKNVLNPDADWLNIFAEFDPLSDNINRQSESTTADKA